MSGLPSSSPRLRIRPPSILPGFGLSLGLTLTYLALIVLLPLSALFFKALDQSWSTFWTAAFNGRVLAAYRLSFGGALFAALVNAFLGTLVAWVLVRYRFPGKKIVNALVDLPFALPTAVAGLALTALYVPNGWIGQFFALLNINIAFTPFLNSLAAGLRDCIRKSYKPSSVKNQTSP